jgi:ribonuclease D
LTGLIDTAEALAPFCERIEAAGTVGFDTEFHGERFYAPRLMIAQVAIGDDVAIIDAVRIADLTPLARALSTVEIVGHALQSDLRILADRFDLLPKRAFDTQLAAAFCGYGMSISLGDLIHSLLGIRLRKAHTVSDWSARPLSDQQMTYLVEDVAHLSELRARLSRRLEELGRFAWFEEEAQRLVDLAEYRPDPERLYLRISGANRMNRRELGVLREIAQLRDTLARERDVPPKYVIPDDAMASLVHLRPKSVDELSQLRRIEAGMRKSYGAKIVEAVERGLALPDDELPARPQRPANSERESIASLLSVLVQQVAADNSLPAALLAPRAALERVARELPPTVADLANALAEDGAPGGHWRAGVIAQPLWSLLHGEVALRIEGSAAGSPRVGLDRSRRGDS